MRRYQGIVIGSVSLACFRDTSLCTVERSHKRAETGKVSIQSERVGHTGGWSIKAAC